MMRSMMVHAVVMHDMMRSSVKSVRSMRSMVHVMMVHTMRRSVMYSMVVGSVVRSTRPAVRVMMMVMAPHTVSVVSHIVLMCF